MMTSSPIPSPADVVSIRVRFMDQAGAKTRPAVVLSNFRFNESRGYFVFTPLTGSPGSFSDESVAEIADIGFAGLNRPTFSHGILRTARNVDIQRILGRLSGRDDARIRQLVAEIIPL